MQIVKNNQFMPGNVMLPHEVCFSGSCVTAAQISICGMRRLIIIIIIIM